MFLFLVFLNHFCKMKFLDSFLRGRIGGLNCEVAPLSLSQTLTLTPDDASCGCGIDLDGFFVEKS